VCSGETRSTSSRSSSCGDPVGAETRGDCDGVVPRDEFKELPSRFVPSAVPALDAEPGTRKSASFLCLCVGGLGVASPRAPRRDARRCDRSGERAVREPRALHRQE
jgi:hypothetical protein